MMTTNLEKTFFKAFEIKPKYTYLITDTFYTDDSHTYGATKNDLIDCFEGKNCGRYKVVKVCKSYPQITDHILLELFDILRKYYNLDFWTTDNSFVMDMRDKSASYTNILYRTGGDLKHSILSSLQLIVNQKLNYNEKIKHQVQELFKE